MDCPRCGHATPAGARQCPACGAAFAQSSVATGTVSIDTTGLPPGATFGASTSLGARTTLGPGANAVEGSTIGEGLTVDGTSRPASAGPLTVGQAFGPRYHIIKLLGAGGMGAVYQAWDAELGVAVAVKVIRMDRRRGSASSEVEKQFKNELLLARQVTHKNVVRIHDLGEINGIKYITMPYVQGDDLATVLRHEGKVPIARALQVARHIADGLAAAHEAGVVHRDLKPANVMIGADDQALIMDFGISASASETSSEGIIGTLEYMAPEQSKGAAVDSRADIYAFGLILYEMLTGPRPAATTGQERVEAMKRRTAEGLPPVRSLDETIPAPLDALVMRCLERDPVARFNTTADLVAALAALDDAGELIPIPPRFGKRLLAASAVVVLSLIAGTWWLARTPPPAAALPPVSVLIADFQNHTGDRSLEGSVEQALAISMEGASFLTAYSREGARKLAEQLKPGSTLDEQMAQVISTREGIKYVLSGTIDAVGPKIRFAIKALDPADGHAISTVTATASTKDDVLKTVGSLAVQLRQALGDTTPRSAGLAEMDPVTTTSLEAIQAYSRGQDLSLAGKPQDALQAFEQAIALDPELGRAYAQMAVIHGNLKRSQQAEENFQKALKYVDRMTEREKYRTLGSYYFLVARNYEKAIENYETLVRLYPADNSGHANLAFAHLLMGNLDKAVDEGRRAIEIYPRNLLQRTNYAMYAMYAGDFKTAINEANTVLKDNPQFEYAILTVARAALASGDLDGARAALGRLHEASTFGASLANLGQADLAMYLGRYREALQILSAGIAADEKAGNASDAAPKYVALAEAHLALGARPRATAAALKAISLSRQESVLFPAARVLIDVGRKGEVEKVAGDLENMLQRQTVAYARALTGELSLKENRLALALEALRDSQKRYDSWFARYLLGRTYLEAGHFAEALPELEWCFKRKGLAADVFIADSSTLRYFPPVQYWLARAQEALNATDVAQRNYREFVNVRATADPPDPLAIDARKRLASAPPPPR